jgi:hypothetical protein
MNAYAMSFDGALLERGFWIYVWRITGDDRTVLYVGRTGDSSSPHASSPFRRIGQHLQAGPNAKANALARQLQTAGLVPGRCGFEMVAVGPLFPEQENMERHREVRDQVGALERALADHLRDAGHQVIGHHPRAIACDDAMCAELCRIIDQKLGTPEPSL